MLPFTLPGPQFLLFYAVFGGLVLGGLRFWRRRAEDRIVPRLSFDDPCAIAFLRGGAPEAIRVAMLSLIDRGLLRVDATKLHTETVANVDRVRRPLEKALLTRLKVPSAVDGVAQDASLAHHCTVYQDELERRGLLPDAGQREARRRRLWAAVAVLWTVALVKIAVALAAGRANVGFLIVMTLIVTVLAVLVARPRRTASGDRTLADLRTLFGRLRHRGHAITRGGTTQEAALLAAVFGFAALPPAYADARSALERRDSGDSGSATGGSDSGSSGCGGGGRLRGVRR